jgi:hypothetical protein
MEKVFILFHITGFFTCKAKEQELKDNLIEKAKEKGTVSLVGFKPSWFTFST